MPVLPWASLCCGTGLQLRPTPLQTTAANVMAANSGLPVVCIENAGSIRTDIPAGNVTLGQVTTVLPFGST